MRNLYRKSREYIPLFSFIIFVISIISLILYIIVLNSVEFADFFNYYLTTPIRLALAGISSIVPFSISETLLFASPIWITLLFARGIKNAKISKPTAKNSRTKRLRETVERKIVAFLINHL